MKINVTLDLDEAAVTALERLGRQHGRNLPTVVQFLCCSAAAYSLAARADVEAALLLAQHAQRTLAPLAQYAEGTQNGQS